MSKKKSQHADGPHGPCVEEIKRLGALVAELREVLEDLVKQVEEAEPGTFIVVGDALAALAKARGEQTGRTE
jgi:hypothetical protein